jgi:class 3 adenylate cyclase
MADNADRRKLTAVLCTDVKGYSKLMGDKEPTAKIIEIFWETIAKPIEQLKGQIDDFSRLQYIFYAKYSSIFLYPVLYETPVVAKYSDKEDKVFFPSSRNYFTDEEDQAKLVEFWEFDRNMIHQKYKSLVDGFEGLKYIPP